MSDTTYLLVKTLSSTVTFYTVLIFIRILLSWFPNVDWYNQPFATLSQLTDPYLNLFRSIIPPLGGLDLSPILGIFLLQVVAESLQQLTVSLMY